MIEQLNSTAEAWWDWMAGMFWQVGLLIVLIACIDRLIRRWAWPQLRYALWSLILIKLILPPTMSLPSGVVPELQPMVGQALRWLEPEETVANEGLIEPARFGLQTMGLRASLDRHSAIAVVPVPEPVLADAQAAMPASAHEGSPQLRWQAYAMMAWLVGIIVLGLWLVLRLHSLAGRRAHLAAAASLTQSFYNQLAGCAKRLGLRRVPRVAVARRLATPAVFGVFRPVLLMPKGYLGKLSRRDTEHMLLHELAHIRRGDLTMHGLYLLLQIVYWHNPLLWLVRRQMHHLRELSCDATVAELLRERTTAYRQTLLETARRLLATSAEPGLGLLGLFEDSNRLAVRLDWLAKPTWRYRTMKRVFVAMIAMLMFVCVLPMAQGQANPAVADEATKQQYEEQVSQELAELRAKLAKLEVERLKLQKELQALAEAHAAAGEARQAAETARKAVAEARQAADGAAKASVESKKAKRSASAAVAVVGKAKAQQAWADEMGVLAQQMQQWENSKEMQEWQQAMQHWQHSEEFKEWQKAMQEWGEQYAETHAQTHTSGHDPAHAPVVPAMPPMAAMPPMPTMPPMAAMPPMPAPPSHAAPSHVHVPAPGPTPNAHSHRVVVPKVKFPKAGAAPVVVPTPEDGEWIEAATESEYVVKSVKPGGTFEVNNNVGSVSVVAGDGPDCKVKAIVKAKGVSAEEAKSIAEKVEVRITPKDDDVRLDAKLPEDIDKEKREKIQVAFEIAVPAQVNVQVAQRVGNIRLAGLRGEVKAMTQVGDIRTKDVKGDVALHTNVGSINMTVPDDVSAKVSAATRVGSIDSDLGLAITGAAAVQASDVRTALGSSATGVLGTGEDKIHLNANVGSIRIHSEAGSR